MEIKTKQSLSGNLSGNKLITGAVVGTARVTGTVSISTGGVTEPYMGEYEITPKVDAQTMYTRNKYMIEDVEIKGVPIFSVTNNSGGDTVYIAEEVI